MTTYTYKTPMTINIEHAIAPEDILTQRIKQWRKENDLSDEDIEKLNDLIDDAKWEPIQSPLFREDQPDNFKIKVLADTPITQHNLLLNNLDYMSYENLAENQTNKKIISIAPISFEIKDDSFIIFEINTISELTKAERTELEEFMVGQLSDGWGENGTDTKNYNLSRSKLRSEPAIRELNKYDDVCYSPYNPFRFSNKISDLKTTDIIQAIIISEKIGLSLSFPYDTTVKIH